MNPRGVFKRALQDPVLEGVGYYTGPSSYAKIAIAIKDLPEKQ